MFFFSQLYEYINQVLIHIFLGIVQGFTEFLPISSTAHLIAIPNSLGIKEPTLSVIASLQLGSIFAVIIYFWNDLKNILSGLLSAIEDGNWSKPNTKLGTSILIGNIPIVFAGILIKLLWKDYETSFLRTIPIIAIVSIVMSILLAISEIYGSRKKDINDIQIFNGFIIGLSQVLALIPGVSRSGITITTSLLSGFDRSSSARFSFLLGIPAISIAGLVELREIFSTTSISEFIPLFFGIISSAISSWIAIDFLIKFLKTNTTNFFIYYRLAFGSFLLVNWHL
tara:strand:- start:311 stop:1159 length:849 start_codon:yes stop_codon:yes gene_type:complete